MAIDIKQNNVSFNIEDNFADLEKNFQIVGKVVSTANDYHYLKDEDGEYPPSKLINAVEID